MALISEIQRVCQQLKDGTSEATRRPISRQLRRKRGKAYYTLESTEGQLRHKIVESNSFPDFPTLGFDEAEQ